LISTLFFLFAFFVPNLDFSLCARILSCRFPARESTIRDLFLRVSGERGWPIRHSHSHSHEDLRSLLYIHRLYTRLQWSRLIARLLPTASLLPRSTTSSTHLVLPPTPCGVTRYVTTIARRRWTRNHRGDFPLIRPRSHQVRFFFSLVCLLVIVSKGILACLVNLLSIGVRSDSFQWMPYYSVPNRVLFLNILCFSPVLLSLFPHRVSVHFHRHHRSIPSCGLLI